MARVPGAPVIGQDGRVAGVVDLTALAEVSPDELVGDHITTREPLLAADDGLDDALGTLSYLRRDWAPVVSGGRPTGVLSVSDAIAAYRTALNGNTRQVRGFRAGGVEREDALVIARGDLAIAAGDRLSIFAEPAARPELMAMLERRIEPSAAAQVTPVAGPGTL